MSKNHSSKLDMSKSQPPENVNGALFGKEILADIIKISRSSWFTWVGTKSNDKYPHKRRAEERQRKGPDDNGGRDWGDEATSQGRLESSEAGTGRKDPPWSCRRERSPLTLTSGLHNVRD